MADNEVEKLVVTLEANYQDFLRQIDKAVQEAAAKLKEVDDAPKKSKTSFEQLGGYLSGKFLSIITSIGAAMAVAFSVNSIAAFFTGIAKGAVDAGAQLETFEVQFTTLLGSAEKAGKRIQELIKFADMTPFETDQVIEADRLLQTFGGTVLATGENLRRVGDSAAAVNANFSEVAFWTGRLYAAIQSGRPFGEASARLSELAILSGTTRTKMEDMQKAGEDGAKIWELYASTIDTKFAGAMEKLAKTFEGVMSNLRAFQDMLLREGGATFFEGMREDAVEFYDILNQPAAKEALVSLAKGFGDIATALEQAVSGAFLDTIKDIDPQDIKQLGDALGDFAKALAVMVKGEGGTDVEGFIESITVLIDGLTIELNKLNDNIETLRSFGITLTDVSEAMNRVVNPGANASAMFRDLSEIIAELTGQDMSDASREAVNSLDEQNEAAEAAKEAYLGMRGSMQAAADAAQELKDAEAAEELARIAEEAAKAAAELEAARDALGDMAAGFRDLKDDTAEKLQEAEADHGEKITEIDQDFADKQADIAKDRDDALIQLEKDTAEKRQDIAESTGEALAKLEKDTAKQREEINEKANENLAKLADDANSQVDKLGKEHYKKQLRETEDHQRDMQKLQEDYMFDLQDAVTARDARAIVDLRRRLQKEKAEKEKDFRTNQDRDNDDLAGRIRETRETERQRRQEILKSQRDQLADLEESEAEKRGEILASQAEQLADLAENEAEKRQSIEDSYQEQMAKAAEHHAEQTARENEQYEERRQKINEALQKRLEDEMKALADNEAINEEHAQKILEILNKTFGIGGDIDALMEDFTNRRRQKMTVQISFDQATGEAPESSGRPSSRPGAQNQPSRPSSRPGLANRPHFQMGGLVPGAPGSPLDAIIHGGEFVIPHDQVVQMRQGNAGGEMRVKLDISGSAPPGIRGGEVDAIASVLVRALSEAGVRARR